MRKKVFSLLSLLIAFLGFSQTTVYFIYDEAGNQRYCGPDINCKQAPSPYFHRREIINRPI